MDFGFYLNITPAVAVTWGVILVCIWLIWSFSR